MTQESEQRQFSNTDFYQFNITIGLALSLSKLCAEKCRLFKFESGAILSENDTQCVKTCAASINSNYSVFTNQLKEVINFEDAFGTFEPEE